jgi:uncharacterized protein YjiS (DUF1127 family)
MPYDTLQVSRRPPVHQSTVSENRAAFEDVAACNTCSDSAAVFVRYGSAGNDSAISEDGAEIVAPHAIAANDLGNVAASESTSFALLGSYELHRVARTYRSLMLGSIIVAAVQAVVAIARRAYARQRQRQRASAIYDVLRRFDDLTLRDMGFDRNEIGSVAAEMSGKAEQIRVRSSILDETPDRSYWTRYDHFMAEREAHTRRST